MRKSKYTFFDKILLFIAVVLALALLLGIAAGKTDPQKNILVAYFGLAFPYVLMANVCMLAFWLLRKKWFFAIFTFAIIAYGHKPLYATFRFTGDQGLTKKAENSIRVMTYNVHGFKPYGDANSVAIKEKMLEVVKEQNPDIICFQEFFTRYKGPYNTLDSLKKILHTKYYYFLPVSKNDYEAYGLAIYSKYPIKDKGEILFKQGLGDNMSIYADLDVSGKTLRIYNTHFQSISFEKQDYDYLDNVKEMNTKVKPTKRILKMLKTAFLARSKQVDLMKREMANCKVPYLIAGDFNDTPASFAVTQITKDLNNAFVSKGQGFGKTYNGKFPNFQIDYIATTKDLDIVNYKIIEAKLSDHFPVRSDIKFKE